MRLLSNPDRFLPSCCNRACPVEPQCDIPSNTPTPLCFGILSTVLLLLDMNTCTASVCCCLPRRETQHDIKLCPATNSGLGPSLAQASMPLGLYNHFFAAVQSCRSASRMCCRVCGWQAWCCSQPTTSAQPVAARMSAQPKAVQSDAMAGEDCIQLSEGICAVRWRERRNSHHILRL